MGEEYETLQDVCTRINGLWGEITGKHISDNELRVVLHELSSAITRIGYEITTELKSIQDKTGISDSAYKILARQNNIEKIRREYEEQQ